MFQDVAGIWKVLVREEFFMHQMEADAPHLCRGEPARDGSVSVSNYLTDRPLSRAGSLLQGAGCISKEEVVTRYCLGLASA
jgi:hypothetical protein